MIDYIEIRDENREIVGVIDTAQSIIWHSVYFGVGDFEIFTQATAEALSLLKVGRYITRPNNAEVGIVEKIERTDTESDGQMLAVTGRFAKALLDRRLIYRLSGSVNAPTILRGNVEEAVREVVKNNAISCPFDSRRNIPVLSLGEFANTEKTIIDENGNAAQKQVSFENLLTYTDGVLEEYGLSAFVAFSTYDNALRYTVFEGTDRSLGNAGGFAPVVFSQEFDNLSDSVYTFDSAPERNVALIGGAGEGMERFYSLIGAAQSGLNRRELFVDASSISRTYKDEDEQDQTYTDAEYTSLLNAQGRQTLAPLVPEESFSGTIETTAGNWIFGRDFFLGDLVSVQDNNLGLYINVRIREVLECQDENGYSVTATYE